MAQRVAVIKLKAHQPVEKTFTVEVLVAKRLAGSVAFITGAARGMGRSHAVTLAREGADIIAVDFLEQVPGAPYQAASSADVAELEHQVEETGQRIHFKAADVRNASGLTDAVSDAVTELGRLDIVVANAGITNQMAPSDVLDEDMWQNMIDTNLTGVWHTVKTAIPHIKAGGRGGAIVIISSVAGLSPLRNNAHYVSAKHGLVGLMKALALELAADNIRVNSVHPATVNTPMVQNDTTWELFAGKQGVSYEEFDQVARGMVALPIPWSEPEDVSNAVLFLVSQEARCITGVALPVDCGYLLT